MKPTYNIFAFKKNVARKPQTAMEALCILYVIKIWIGTTGKGWDIRLSYALIS